MKNTPGNHSKSKSSAKKQKQNPLFYQKPSDGSDEMANTKSVKMQEYVKSLQ